MAQTSASMTHNGEAAPYTAEQWAADIARGDMRAISRAITTVENRAAAAAELIRLLYPRGGRAKLIGVTGAPGSGKSTLVDAITAALRAEHKKVGILAVDPSSPFSGGAILGDRIRMQVHATDGDVFIRSMATRGALGGLANATLDAAIVLDASGCDYIIIETVGVGQAEVEISRIADIVLLVLVPGMGDEVQAFKAGIMEIADVFVINKSDLPGVGRLEQEIRALLSLAPNGSHLPEIIRTVATARGGIDDLLAAVGRFLNLAREKGILENRRAAYWRDRMIEIARERLLAEMLAAVGMEALSRMAQEVAERRLDPYTAVDTILERVRAAH